MSFQLSAFSYRQEGLRSELLTFNFQLSTLDL